MRSQERGSIKIRRHAPIAYQALERKRRKKQHDHKDRRLDVNPYDSRRSPSQPWTDTKEGVPTNDFDPLKPDSTTWEDGRGWIEWNYC